MKGLWYIYDSDLEEIKISGCLIVILKVVECCIRIKVDFNFLK